MENNEYKNNKIAEVNVLVNQVTWLSTWFQKSNLF